MRLDHLLSREKWYVNWLTDPEVDLRAGRSESEEESERAIGKRKRSERFEGSEAGEAMRKRERPQTRAGATPAPVRNRQGQRETDRRI